MALAQDTVEQRIKHLTEGLTPALTIRGDNPSRKALEGSPLLCRTLSTRSQIAFPPWRVRLRQNTNNFQSVKQNLRSMRQALGRVDWRPTTKQSYFGRYAYYVHNTDNGSTNGSTCLRPSLRAIRMPLATRALSLVRRISSRPR